MSPYRGPRKDKHAVIKDQTFVMVQRPMPVSCIQDMVIGKMIIQASLDTKIRCYLKNI
jgi:hypothetical protein